MNSEYIDGHGDSTRRGRRRFPQWVNGSIDGHAARGVVAPTAVAGVVTRAFSGQCTAVGARPVTRTTALSRSPLPLPFPHRVLTRTSPSVAHVPNARVAQQRQRRRGSAFSFHKPSDRRRHRLTAPTAEVDSRSQRHTVRHRLNQRHPMRV